MASDKFIKKQTSKDFPDCFYRVAVKGLCVRDGKILLMREAKSLGGGWELPGGGLEFDEGIRDGFKREVQEETGLKITHISEKPVYAWTTRVENWRGMDWYYTLILGYRIEFKNLDFTPTDECMEVQFFSKEEMQKLDHSMNLQTKTFLKVFNPKDFEGDF